MALDLTKLKLVQGTYTKDNVASGIVISSQYYVDLSINADAIPDRGDSADGLQSGYVISSTKQKDILNGSKGIITLVAKANITSGKLVTNVENPEQFLTSWQNGTVTITQETLGIRKTSKSDVNKFDSLGDYDTPTWASIDYKPVAYDINIVAPNTGNKGVIRNWAAWATIASPKNPFNRQLELKFLGSTIKFRRVTLSFNSPYKAEGELPIFQGVNSGEKDSLPPRFKLSGSDNKGVWRAAGESNREDIDDEGDKFLIISRTLEKIPDLQGLKNGLDPAQTEQVEWSDADIGTFKWGL